MKHLWLGVLASALSACGDSAVEKCDALLDTLCDRQVQCVPASGSHELCVQQFQQLLPCGRAKDVSATYDRCVDQIEAASCAVLFPNNQIQLPADCTSVILTARLRPAGADVGAFSEMMAEQDP